MTQRIAILAPGQMGAGIGAVLVDHGVEVVTPLEGRSAASQARAKDAGMQPAGDDEVVACDFVLSILPPAVAVEAARRCVEACKRTGCHPIFAEMNAVSPATTLGIGAMVSSVDMPFVDGGIVGPPPSADGKAPTMYVSGPAAPPVAVLNDYGLKVRIMDAPLGAASALKMCYSGINKGVIGIATAMLTAAYRAGVGDTLLEQLEASQRHLLTSLRRGIPGMVPKAARWAPEMREIESFIGEQRPEHAIYAGAAGLYERIGEPRGSMADEIDRLLRALAE
jgi:3-hydroxyisobutyrate dehydrogenase-like beta-hydroxyacid dehydrogenase